MTSVELLAVLDEAYCYVAARACLGLPPDPDAIVIRYAVGALLGLPRLEQGVIAHDFLPPSVKRAAFTVIEGGRK